MGENPGPWADDQFEVPAPVPNDAVVERFKVEKGLTFSADPFSLSRSSAPPWFWSLKSVRRRVSDGGTTGLDSSREKREADGEASECALDGKGKASPVSRRRFPGRALVGDERPYAPGPEIDVLRSDRPSFGVPSLLFWAGGFSGELTLEVKS